MREDTEKFIQAALEASIYVRPREPGLTEDEIRSVAEVAGFKLGQVKDACKSLYVQYHGRRFLPKIHPGLSGFMLPEDSDRRNPQALQFIRQHLKEVAADVGRANARIERDQLVAAGVAQGLPEHDLEVAIAILVLDETLKLDGSHIVHTKKNDTWAMPLAQIEANFGTDELQHGVRERSLFRESYDILVKRLDSHATTSNIGQISLEKVRGTPGVAQKMSSFRIFVSHSSKDAMLAKALVDCLEDSLDVPDHTIRCTSVPGYKLASGDVSDEVLRENLEQCSVVIGLLTAESLKSGYVVMELGAGWGLKKTTCALLVGEVEFNQIPGPLGRRHAGRAEIDHDVADLMDVVGERAGLASRNRARCTVAVNRFVAAAKATAP